MQPFLHSQGYRYYHSCKKGLLTSGDLKRRLKYATEISKRLDSKQLGLNNRILYYTLGVGFQHKYNLFDEAKSIKIVPWRKRDGLERNCTAKENHVGSGGKVLHFMVAISYTQGVILCEQYEGNINGQKIPVFICDHFPRTFEKNVNPTGKLFLHDGDPSQNRKAVKQVKQAVGATKFSITPRSPNMSPIENVSTMLKTPFTVKQQSNKSLSKMQRNMLPA